MNGLVARATEQACKSVALLRYRRAGWRHEVQLQSCNRTPRGRALALIEAGLLSLEGAPPHSPRPPPRLVCLSWRANAAPSMLRSAVAVFTHDMTSRTGCS